MSTFRREWPFAKSKSVKCVCFFSVQFGPPVMLSFLLSFHSRADKRPKLRKDSLRQFANTTVKATTNLLHLILQFSHPQHSHTIWNARSGSVWVGYILDEYDDQNQSSLREKTQLFYAWSPFFLSFRLFLLRSTILPQHQHNLLKKHVVTAEWSNCAEFVPYPISFHPPQIWSAKRTQLR